MRSTALILAAALVCGAAVASATPPLTVKHGRSIHVTIGGRTEDAFALRPTPGGWRLALGGAGSGGTLILRDVTLGATGPRTFELPFAPEVVLDEARFRADHAYRVDLRRGTIIVGSALLYLQPQKRRGPVVFDDADASKPASDDGLTTSDKGSL
ncbi:MAG TPA: hypothetical protein VF997_06760 [Polyangia bacterium]